LAVRPQDRPQNVAELRGALEGRRVPPPVIRPHSPTREKRAAAALDADFPITQRLAVSMYSMRCPADPTREAVDLAFPIIATPRHAQRKPAGPRGESLQRL